MEEALIVSDLFQLNELSAALLVVHGEEQLPQYPGLTRGLVAVLLYYDGRKALVQVRMEGMCKVQMVQFPAPALQIIYLIFISGQENL